MSGLTEWQVGGREGLPAEDVGEAEVAGINASLARAIELESGDASATRQDGRVAEVAQLAAVDEGFEDVLLVVQVGVDDGIELLTEGGQLVDGLGHAIAR